MDNLFDIDFLELGVKADRIRQRMWGKKTFFVKNLHLNYTNICVSKCRFCAFQKDEGEDGAYIFEIDHMLRYVAEKAPDACEIHIVGGLHPSKPFSFYTDAVSALKSAYPEKTIKAFSAVEIAYFAGISGLSENDVLKKLKKAGLEMMPGGGAEIFDPEVRNIICPEKITAEHWQRIHETAHENGIFTNATMLYGHIEKDEHIMRHLDSVRNLQEKTGGFLAFIPLAFHPENTFLSDLFPATGVDDLKTIAVSRIMLENVPHIKAYWVMLGEKTAQTALRFGADDLDGTIIKENITHAAGAKSSEGLVVDTLVDIVSSAGLTAVERDAFYNEIKVYG
ncbi:Radical SAM domain protein [Denitrovibrio acetiphilus DSM 12809]|uniref:Aminodeoxyfutalosine synthase n=1 Tax=Denitrovibrio acetiphilus (strain DSM 12809 / NBRC 114555 / N2460) TaxID=522772 RepID=D4H0U3_DENA2|nr:aminofutalosine synthase MqnE [Denitrovibrio acetiphilus]ADD68606.1 Radical SAM domain protein [Denitrovibrio acetiphilus DSM 12809]